MLTEHANICLLKKLDITSHDCRAALFHPDVVWHFFNPKAPDLSGDYHGIEGIADFLERLQSLSNGTFRIEPQDARAIGSELVVAQTRNRFSDGETMTEFDVATVWRVFEGKIAEVWDIPAVYTADIRHLT
ncbi:MAG: nuclear transport factor 2 family protein [Pseudomonadota bacterium]